MDLVQILEANLLQILQTLDTRQIGRHEIALAQEVNILLRKLRSHPLFLVELQAGVEHRLVLQVKELIVVGLEDLRDQSRCIDRVAINASAEHGLHKGIGVGAADSDILWLLVRARAALIKS